MAFAVEGFATIAQNHISRGIASNFYNKLPFLAALGSFSLGNQKSELEIGRPKGEILSGKNLSPAEKLALGRVNFYQPRIQKFETNNSKWMAKYDTRPTVGSATTNAHSQAMQASAKFGWAELETPILVWHEDKMRAQNAGTKEGQGIAMSQLIDEATEVAFQEHIKKLNDGIWNGNPTSQSADLWDAPLGLVQAFDNDNTYGNVDRTVEDDWDSGFDSTSTAVDIAKIIDDANLGNSNGINKGARVYGDGIDLVITTTALYRQFKAQVLAQGGVVLQNGMPNMGQYGVKQEVLKKDNVHIMYDPTCGANRVYCFSMGTWKLALHPDANLKVLPFVDISRYAEGAKKADQSFITTRLIFSCDNPPLNSVFTAIGT